jgi:hypothetical protein
MDMTRRSLFAMPAGAALIDPGRAGWVKGAKVISMASPDQVGYVEPPVTRVRVLVSGCRCGKTIAAVDAPRGGTLPTRPFRDPLSGRSPRWRLRALVECTESLKAAAHSRAHEPRSLP